MTRVEEIAHGLKVIFRQLHEEIRGGRLRVNMVRGRPSPVWLLLGGLSDVRATPHWATMWLSRARNQFTDTLGNHAVEAEFKFSIGASASPRAFPRALGTADT
jgi:hypothetical protein